MYRKTFFLQLSTDFPWNIYSFQTLSLKKANLLLLFLQHERNALKMTDNLILVIELFAATSITTAASITVLLFSNSKVINALLVAIVPRSLKTALFVFSKDCQIIIGSQKSRPPSSLFYEFKIRSINLSLLIQLKC